MVAGSLLPTILNLTRRFSMSIYKHKHHIIPKHVGGTDDLSNILLLTVEEHAEAHRKLYEEYGRWQDKIAWKTLSGQISKAEAIRETSRLANIGNKNAAGINHGGGKPKGWKLTNEETRKKLKESHMGNTSRLGTGGTPFHTEEYKENMRKRMTGTKRIIDENGKIRYIKPNQ